MLRILNKSGALKPSNVVLAASLSTTSARLGSSSLKDFKATNEPILDYKRDSAERAKLKESLDGFAKLSAKSSGMYEVPIVIGDKEIRTKDVRYQVLPFDHKVKLARFYYADKALLKEAIQNSLEARAAWESTSVDYRCQVLLKAADKLANEKRGDILAATMLGQGKTIFQAEIDAACELIDFFRFNVQFLQEALTYKPLDAGTHTVNNMQLRGLEGFVAAIAPFNFTAIAGNLASVPALMGNVVLFKPSDTAVYSSYMVYKVLRECGLPAGVINFVPANGADFGEVITSSPHLSGVNFTGSVPTFRWLWSKIGQNLNTYNTFPKISGECGGKNFHLIHESADIESAAVATVRSAFEYSGQKCSACSRLYVPESKWPQMRDRMVSMMKDLKIQSPLQFETFTSAVIDEKSFDRISNYIDLGKKELNLIAGGRYDKSTGYYIYPTMFETKDPKHRIMREELFGPVLAVYVYKNSEYEKAMELIDTTTPFALTGSIFAQDENVLNKSIARLKQACGNMYINDKSTGAVVNQQPFGGARLSGTNDKPGGPHNILKWTSPLSIKRYLLPQAESSIKHSSML